MNTYECNDPLAALLNELRENQRAFFKSQPGSLAKAEALKRAKTLEKELDQFLEMRNRDNQSAHSTKMTDKNKDNRIALFEAAVRYILKQIEDGPKNVQSISQAVCLEYVGGKTVQVQVTVQTDENEFIDDFTSVINHLYSA